MTKAEWEASLAKIAWASERNEHGLRYHVPFIEFDARSVGVTSKPTDDWSEEARDQHFQRIERLKRELSSEYGSCNIEEKYQNFIDIGSLPHSISSHHNDLMHQSRRAFVMGLYYASLTASCSLGERMLNHMILDTKESWQHLFSNNDLRDGRPIQSWNRMINFLTKGNVLTPIAKQAFERLHGLRNRSVHFNLKTIARQRSDAQRGLQFLKNIIESQYACFGNECPWIEFDGFRFFIKRDYEQHPFVHAYYPRICPKIGPRYYYRIIRNLWIVTEYTNYDDGDLTDDQYADIRKSFNNSELPTSEENSFTSDDRITYAWINKQYFIVIGLKDTDKGQVLELVDPLYGTPGHSNQESPVAYYS